MCLSVGTKNLLLPITATKWLCNLHWFYVLLYNLSFNLFTKRKYEKLKHIRAKGVPFQADLVACLIMSSVRAKVKLNKPQVLESCLHKDVEFSLGYSECWLTYVIGLSCKQIRSSPLTLGNLSTCLQQRFISIYIQRVNCHIS